MHLITSSKHVTFIIALAGSVLTLTLLLFIYLNLKNVTTEVPKNVISNPVTSPIPTPINLNLPVRLIIPKINIDSAIESIGLTADGVMDNPKDPNNVAWLNLGKHPGEDGTAVIAGHYGIMKNGKGSVFDNLYKLRTGDTLSVEDNNGALISFIVRKSRRYDPNSDATAVFSSNDGISHLNLITCEGEWNNISKTYSQRLVVFTDKK